MLNWKCNNKKDTAAVIRRETVFCVEQLLPDLDGAEGHTGLFITLELEEEMVQGLFKWMEKTEQVHGLIHPKGDVELASEVQPHSAQFPNV